LENTPRADLPAVTEQGITELLDYLIAVLTEQHDCVEATDKAEVNGNGHARNGEPFDPEMALLAMAPDGASVEEVQRRVILSWLQRGEHPQDILDKIVDHTMAIADRAQLGWRRDYEVSCVTTRICNQFRYAAKEHADARTLPPWLPGDLHESWLRVIGNGGRPRLSKNQVSWFIRTNRHSGQDDSGSKERPGRAWQRKHGRENDEASAGARAEKANEQPNGGAGPKTTNSERKYRFRLVAFQEMRPGLEPVYLVDELIPSAGLVLIWGKQKTYKSFWVLDLMLHVAMGWPYRDRAVRQGTVVYCAFEGAHGYKGRSEALRRHYLIPDETPVPLYIMPGQADLITDEKTLIADFREQLGETKPLIVVLDTLNRSLKGSESSDEDMTKYTRAAEAIRTAFGCVVIIVHHCGYDETHARGHTSLPAAVDAELSVTRAEGSPFFQASVKNMRDGPEGTFVRNRAHIVPLDPDQEGRPRSSVVVVPDDGPAIPGSQSGRPDSAYPTLLSALRLALSTHGIQFSPDNKMPVQAVDEAHVRPLFYRNYIDGEDDKKKSADAQRMAFRRALKKAIEAKIVCGQKDDRGNAMLWFASAEENYK